MNMHGTLNFAIFGYRGERGEGGGYFLLFTESFEMDGVGTVVKSVSPNVNNGELKMIGKGCSVPGWESLIATPDKTPAQAASAFCLHNEKCHDEEFTNRLVYLFQVLCDDE